MVGLKGLGGSGLGFRVSGFGFRVWGGRECVGRGVEGMQGRDVVGADGVQEVSVGNLGFLGLLEGPKALNP